MRLKVKIRKPQESLFSGLGLFDDPASQVLSQFRFSLVAVTGEKEATIALFHGWYDALNAARMFTQYMFGREAKSPAKGQIWKRRKGGSLAEVESVYSHEGRRWVGFRFLKSGKSDQAPQEAFLNAFKLERMAPDGR